MKSIFLLLLFTSFTLYSQVIPPDSLIEEVVYTIQNSIDAQNPDPINELFDYDLFKERIFAGLDVDESKQEEFMTGMKKGFDWGQELVNAIKLEGHYTAKSYTSGSDTISAFYRMVSGGGINYHEYEIYYDGEFHIFDVYVFLTGQYISEAMRQVVEPLMLQDDSFMGRLSDLGSKLFGDKKKYMNDLKQFPLIKKALAEKDYQKVHDLYKDLGEKARAMKSMQLQHLLALQHIDTALMTEYIDIYKKDFPDDVSIDLIMIDYYFTLGEYDKALESVENLEYWAEDDGYLQYLKSNIYSVKGDAENFAKFGNLSIEWEPWLSEPYFTMIEYQLKQKNFTEVINLMKKLRYHCSLEYSEESMSGFELFSDFLKSKEYKDWNFQY